MELLKFALKLLGTLEFGVLLRRILAASTISGASKFRLSCVWCHFQFIHCSIVIGLVAFWLIDAFSCFPDLSLSFPYFTSTFSCFQSFIAAIRLEDSATNLADRITSRSLSAGAQFVDKIWQRFKRLEEVRKVRQVCKMGQRNAVLNCSTQYLKGVHQRSVFSFWS